MYHRKLVITKAGIFVFSIDSVKPCLLLLVPCVAKPIEFFFFNFFNSHGWHHISVNWKCNDLKGACTKFEGMHLQDIVMKTAFILL